jgi:S-adenosylmethionine decarboxylase
MKESRLTKINTSVVKPFTGLHIVANLHSDSALLISNHLSLQSFMHDRLQYYELHQVGEVYHAFPEAGYTAIIGLTESHLSIHTWPEHNYITFDIFISNHSKDNTAITEMLYRDIVSFFNATIIEEHFLSR